MVVLGATFHAAFARPPRAFSLQTANTALCYAAMHGHTEVLRFLLSQGAKVNAPNRDGATALMRAALSNELEPARILLANGASVKCKDNYGRTALMYAAMNGSYDVAQLLLQHHASRTDVDQASLPPAAALFHCANPRLMSFTWHVSEIVGCAGLHERVRLGGPQVDR